MPRTIGALDKRKRKSYKTRSDKGKHRKLYRGKKVRTKRQIKFIKRKGRKEFIILRWMEKRRMSIEGWRNWDSKVRMKIKPYVWIFGSVIHTPVAQISTKEAIEEWSCEAIGFPGYFYVLGVSGSPRTKTGKKWVKMFAVTIKDTPTGLKAKMTNNFRLFRYKWFYKD